MAKSVFKHDRYPGARSFADDAVESRLFFGRDDEISELFHLVLSTNLVVLFGRSGLGKTSLLQAGVFPCLRERDLLPLRVRLNRTDTSPFNLIVNAVEDGCSLAEVDYTPGEGQTLWEFFKTLVIWRGDALQVPILILDQFEEVFTLQNQEYRSKLAEELGYLLSNAVPPKVRGKRRANEQLSFSDRPPPLKIIVSLREEYVGMLQELALEIPNIFRTRLRLKPLTRNRAQPAIVKPASLVEKDVLATRPFQYQETTVNNMLDFLEDRDGEIEPFQLQILCSHVEQQVRAEQVAGHTDIKVPVSYLGNNEAMEAIIRDYYQDAIRTLTSKKLRKRARRLCEEGLLSPDGHRESLGEGQIDRDYGLDPKTLQILVNARLLRKEPRLHSFYYELVHDSLARPLFYAKLERRRRDRHGQAVFLTSLLILISLSIFSWYVYTTGLTPRVAGAVLLSKLGFLPLEPEMVMLPAGQFVMGATDGYTGDSNELPAHTVTLSSPVAISKHEVTFELYDTFATATGGVRPYDEGWGRGQRPVINVSWQDAVQFAAWLAEVTGETYRLPSEAEWEYAARAGTETGYWWGEEFRQDGRVLANCDGCGSNWDTSQTAPVGSFVANPFGLHDTAGNVWEWVQDCAHEDYMGAPTDGSSWGEGSGGDCASRLVRGGSWNSRPQDLRSSSRQRSLLDSRSVSVGFRLAKDL